MNEQDSRRAEYRVLKNDIAEIAYSLEMSVESLLERIVAEAAKRQDTPDARTTYEIYSFAREVDNEIARRISEKRYVVELNFLRAKHDGSLYDWRIARTIEIKRRAQNMLWNAIMEKR